MYVSLPVCCRPTVWASSPTRSGAVLVEVPPSIATGRSVLEPNAVYAAPMRLTQFRIEGLGHLSTLVADESAGVAAVIDPRRDVDVYLDAARDADLRITHVLETHLHNDYVSGGRELAALTGATHVIGVGAGLRHDHLPAHDR